MTTHSPNRLARETSPYLLQHADNPVDWYAWNDEALQKARDEDKPILLSVGYSACHWCHVMAHESFEDPEIAELMNEHFVNIKVDREERPDLDKIYQLAHQLLTQRPGGWPLTIFMSPTDHTPFYAGTYLPKTPRYGMASFPEVIHGVAGFYREHRDEVEKQNASVRQVLTSLHRQHTPAQVIDAAPLTQTRSELEQSYDEVQGGFGGAPKFPQPTALERLLEHWAESRTSGQPDLHALAMVTHTLTRMALGGLQDQLGGGFYRYSVDERWMIPHFEKMLYDNGPLLHLYACAAQATGDPLFADTAHGIGAWALREMRSPEGAFYATLDADSESHEGLFYVWTHEALRDILDDDHYALAITAWGLDQKANFEGRWHLFVAASPAELAARFALPEETIVQRLAAARDRLFQARETRVRPHRDEKILTGWNGLMIKGLASAGRRLGEPHLVDAANRALAFIREHLWHEARLLAGCKDGRASLPAYLDDYAFLLDGILELLQARWRSEDLEFAVQLADALLAHFEDPEQGGFFFTADDHEALLYRPKPYGDDATPAGNGIAAHALQRLGHLLGDPRYIAAAERTLKAAAQAMEQAPSWHNALLRALAEELVPPQLVILVGDEETLGDWLKHCTAGYQPHRMVFTLSGAAAEVPPALQHYRRVFEPITAYVCNGTQCSAPVGDLEEFARLLG
ncbi:MAG: thioredoxin domain-containing protein [Proteobacteria bacterium]|nr:MAG: thioredoxin domain-containing protein [Pseudomonadota bacterium]